MPSVERTERKKNGRDNVHSEAIGRKYSRVRRDYVTINKHLRLNIRSVLSRVSRQYNEFSVDVINFCDIFSLISKYL